MTKLCFITAFIKMQWRKNYCCLLPAKRNGFRRRRPDQQTNNRLPASAMMQSRRKPEWVTQEVLRLKALMGNQAGCRSVATSFNRLHGPVHTVGKTFVSETIKVNHYRLACLKRDIRNRQPVAVKVNAVWAMDVTFVTDASGTTIPVLGLLDHGSRLAVHLHTLLNKCSWTLLGHLCLAIGQYGKPKSVRTDNEAVFTSRVFRSLLYLAGIRHQRTQVGAPWQNGRIERFFGTLKPMLRQLTISGVASLQFALDEFVLFYNHVRPHQNLSGLTPAEAWRGLRHADLGIRKYRATLTACEPPQWIQALDGLLVGYYLRS